VIEFFIAYGPLLQVIAVILGLLIAAAILVWLVIGVVLWFVRGTHDSRAEEAEPVEWFDE